MYVKIFVGSHEGLDMTLLGLGRASVSKRVQLNPEFPVNCRPPMGPYCPLPLSSFECTPYINGSKKVVGYHVVRVHWWSTNKRSFSTVSRALLWNPRV